MVGVSNAMGRGSMLSILLHIPSPTHVQVQVQVQAPIGCGSIATDGMPHEGARLSTRTVGVFDSGVGGLAVASALQRLRADVNVRYVADSAHFPYGEKDRTYVRERVLACGKQLVDEGCELVVVACNTACSEGLEALRRQLGAQVPVVGVEPPLKPAMAKSASRRVAVLATRRTVQGKRLARLCHTYAKDADVFLVPMVGLAELVEAGQVDGPQVRNLLERALEEPLERGVDVVALGCTHYSFVQEELSRMLPAHVTVVHPELPVAQHAIRRLVEIQENGVKTKNSKKHENGSDTGRRRIHLGATGCQETFEGAVRRLIRKGALVLDGLVHEDLDQV